MRVLRVLPWLLPAAVSALVLLPPSAVAQETEPPAPNPAEPPVAQATQGAPAQTAPAGPDQGAATPDPRPAVPAVEVVQPAAPASHDATVPRPKTGVTPKKKKSERTGREVVVIDNAELDRMFGGGDDAEILEELTGERPVEADPAGAPKPAGQTRTGSATAAATGPAALPPLPVPRNPQAPQAQPNAAAGSQAGADRAAEIRAELQRLDQKAKHLRNPFLPPAPESEAERAAERDLDAVERLQRIEQDKQKLQQELEKLNGKPGDADRNVS